jgi:hypothetical protein
MRFIQVVSAVPPLALIFVFFLSPATAQSSPASDRGSFDGPAELPRAYVRSSVADAPAPGHKVAVEDSDGLQPALNRAECGDTIELKAGTTFSGLFRFPPKKCDDSHWIVVRTSAPDSALPPEGTRITPCYAGIASLQDRPFHCPSTPSHAMAKIEFNAKGGSGPIQFLDGANHYRFVGIEITRGAGGIVYNLVQTEKGGAAHHLVFDRVWLHGADTEETNRGLMLTGDTYAAVVDSFFSDFKCVAITGACVDAQAIAGGLGSQPQGPFKIVNNFLEAAGEGILFGGGGASVTPADIEIRHNYLYKPPSWRPGHPQFIGAPNGRPYIVKNLFELKNAQRVLFEGNVLENSWGGFTQTGFGIVLTPKNQGDNTCPSCQVTDITIRYCKMSHVASGFQIGNGLSDAGAAPKAGERYSIHDIVVDDIQGSAAKGFGTFALVAMSGAAKAIADAPIPPLRDVKMDHITAFPTDSLLVLGGPVSGPHMTGFSFTNNIMTVGERPVGSTGGGPLKNCAGQQNRNAPGDVLSNCFASYTFDHNALINGGGGWPKGNFSVKNISDVKFADYRGGNGGDYHLLPGSKLKGAASDGKDLGADIDAVNKAISGVQ